MPMRFFIFSFLITLSGATHAQSIQLDQRADELKEWLVDKYGIDSGRIEAVGKGENPSSDPVEARRARIIILE